jgi:DNA-binding NarL/FixJ family response regulator
MAATILFIDDNPRIANGVREAVGDTTDWNILNAEDGITGLNLVRQHRQTLNLVVLDIHMPGLSGKDVLIQIRGLVPDLPILPVTGDSTAITFLDSMGCATTIVKPVRAAELIERITAALNQSPPPPESLPELQAVLEYTQGLVGEKERALRERMLEPGPGQIAVCTSFDTENAIQKDIANQVGNVIVSCAPQNLATTLHNIDVVHTILTVARDVEKVAPTAQTFNIPLIVSTRQLLEGILFAGDERVQGIVLEHPQDSHLVVRMLATALAEVMAGERYIPSVIRRPFNNTPLSEREYQVIMLEIQGVHHKDIPGILNTAPQTVYTQRRSALTKLGLIDHYEDSKTRQEEARLLIEWVQHWWEDEAHQAPDPGII